MANVGDKVTVVIARLSAGYWSITITDDTNGESFSTKQAYSARTSRPNG